MTRYAYEFLGTFFLVLTIGLTVIPGAAGVIAPLAIGGVLMAVIYMGGHASGAHFNHGVTIAIWIRGKLPASEIVPYIAAQVAAAAAAALLVGFLVGRGTPMEIVDVPRVLVAEALFSFLLCFVVLNVATAKATANNHSYGLAIGLVVVAGAFAVGGISGGAFNSAVAVGLGLMKLVSLSDIWMHIVANLGAGALAGVVFRALNPGDK